MRASAPFLRTAHGLQAYALTLARCETDSFSLRTLQDSNLKLGSWQMVLWQPRWVYAETDGMCYQKVSTNDKPIGKAKKILFSAIKDLEELECQEFRVICPDRDFTFKVPETGNSCSCSVMVHNLRQLMLRHREATLSGA